MTILCVSGLVKAGMVQLEQGLCWMVADKSQPFINHFTLMRLFQSREQESHGHGRLWNWKFHYSESFCTIRVVSAQRTEDCNRTLCSEQMIGPQLQLEHSKPTI